MLQQNMKCRVSELGTRHQQHMCRPSLDITIGQNQVDFSLQWANLIGTGYSVSFPRVALIVQGPDSRSNLFLPADK